MKFFVPHADDDAQAERVWGSVRESFALQGWRTTERRIQRIAFDHNGKAYDLEVGGPHPDLNEEVLLVLQAAAGDLYYVCTPKRGVLGGDPYLVGASTVSRIVDFDPS